MDRQIRRKLQMADRVRDFVRALAPDTPGFADAVARLEAQLARAEQLAQETLAGRAAVGRAVAARRAIRREIAGTLRLLDALAERALRDTPDLQIVLDAAGLQRRDNEAFLDRGRLMLAEARRHQELLGRYGLAPALLDQLGERLDAFARTLDTKHAARATHIGARAELDALTDDVMAIVRQLDALCTFRFRDDPNPLTAWRAARNVPWPLADRRAGETDRAA